MKMNKNKIKKIFAFQSKYSLVFKTQEIWQ